MDILVLFGTFILLVILTIPIGYAIGISTLVTLVFFTNMPLALITQNAITGVDSFPLMAIPFFMLAGNLMSTGGVARRIVDFCDTLLGWITGGLAIVTTLACMIFAAISGSAMATTSAIGGFMIPEMTKRGYDKAFSASLAASAGTIGVIIPPSIPFVIYAVVTNQSVSDLFIAGILPGVLMGVALIVVCVIVSKKEGYQTTGKCPSLRDVWKSFKEAFWALMTPVIILGGIYGSIFTPTEAAAVSVVYSFIVGVFIYKELRLRDIFGVIRSAGLTTGTVLVVLGCAAAFTKILTIGQIPQQIAGAITRLTDNKLIILLLLNIVLLFVGCFMDTAPSIMILAPIFLPIVTSLGVDPIHFGIVMIVNLAIGFVTPPLGINLFVASRIGETKLDQVIQGIVPFLISMLVILMLLTYIPSISMLFPNLMMG